MRPDLPPLPPGAILYTPDTADEGLPARFAAELAARGWSVGGISQERQRGPEGRTIAMDLVEIDGGRRIPLSRPTEYHLKSGTCAVEDSALAEASGAIRRAVAQPVDILLIEKYSQRERKGQGLADEILAAIAEGLPVLVAVAAYALEDWTRITGGWSQLLAWDAADLWRWWGPHRLYRDLELGVGDGAARRVVVGRNWTLVEGPDGCGLAQSPRKEGRGCEPLPDSGRLTGRALRDLARLVHSWNPAEAAVGLAAINAFYNRHDLDGEALDGLDLVSRLEEPAIAVGRFPGLSERPIKFSVIETSPRSGEYPATAGGWLLARGTAVITASSLVDRSLPDLLARRPRGRDTVLVGASTPLTRRLLSYGPTALAGTVVTDPDGAARAVAEGAGMKGLKPFCRKVALRQSSS